MTNEEHKESDWSEDNSHYRFGVIAEKRDYPNQLIMTALSFARLVDEIIVPYHTNEAFFIDGVPVTRKDIDRVKIIRLHDSFNQALRNLDIGLNRTSAESRKTYGDQYQIRFEHLLRLNSTDITSQVIQAYDQKIKPSIKNYLPKRDELIKGAWSIFVEAMKQLG